MFAKDRVIPGLFYWLGFRFALFGFGMRAGAEKLILRSNTNDL